MNPESGKLSGSIRMFKRSRMLHRHRLAVLGELDVLLGTLAEGDAHAGTLEVLLDTIGVTLAGGDDGLEVGHARIVAHEGLLGVVQAVGEDVGEGAVEAAALGVGEFLAGLVVVAGEDVEDTHVPLGLLGAGLGEVTGSLLVVTLLHGDHAEGVLELAVLGLNLTEGALRGGNLAGVQQGDTLVEAGAVAVELVDGLLVEVSLLVIVLNEGSGTEEGLFVEDVDVVVNELEELFAGVVLVLDIGDEAGAAEFRKDGALEGGVDLGHVLDLAFADGRVAVHGKDAEDQVLIFDVALGNELLEAFPVLADGLDVGVADFLALGDLAESLLTALGALVGKLGVEVLAAFRGSVGDDFGTGEGLALIGLDLIESGLKVLDGLALELLVVDVRAVHGVLDLAFGGLLDDLLVVVGLVRQVTLGVDHLVSGVAAVGDLAGRELGGLGLVAGDGPQLEDGVLHALDIVEMDMLADGLSCGGNGFIIVLHLLTLVDERLHGRFAAFVDEHRGHFEDSFRMEIIGGIRDGQVGVDVVGDHFEDLGIAGDFDIFGHLDHFLVGGAGDSTDAHEHGCQQFHTFLHINNSIVGFQSVPGGPGYLQI